MPLDGLNGISHAAKAGVRRRLAKDPPYRVEAARLVIQCDCGRCSVRGSSAVRSLSTARVRYPAMDIFLAFLVGPEAIRFVLSYRIRPSGRSPNWVSPSP
jgi:hypothetical protein